MTLGFIHNLGIWELVIILVVILIIFGPGKLPEVGKAIGKSLRSFKDAQKTVEDDIAKAVRDDDKPAQKDTPTDDVKKAEN